MGNCFGKTEAELKEDREREQRITAQLAAERKWKLERDAIRNKEWMEKYEADKQDAYRNWGNNQSDYIYR